MITIFNQSVIIGRLVNDMELSEDDTLEIVVVVQRSYKINGEYITDFINCILKDNLATRTVEYCRKGDLVAIKGSIEVEDNKILIRAEKISFLTNKTGADGK